ncbi:uncharacterized protein LOC106152521 isoform X1 [Lingula anatina]|uniref:Uncharacterized protein LOC106152521 isoform X1 n=1 Tax=Lingula anatina TaxID=7574 RepID=A0A1S3H640_LINAN|nr:uncharacterized protein LOC106152521 isoform X1 [Lingula anatina]|eukprot:XP_013381585.1 uncharacterized protein LOC106152521 isoform X1 [Lingula anatina]
MAAAHGAGDRWMEPNMQPIFVQNISRLHIHQTGDLELMAAAPPALVHVLQRYLPLGAKANLDRIFKIPGVWETTVRELRLEDDCCPKEPVEFVFRHLQGSFQQLMWLLRRVGERVKKIVKSSEIEIMIGEVRKARVHEVECENLSKHLSYIADEGIDIMRLLDFLFSSSIISYSDIEEINCQQTSSDKCSLLLHKVLECPLVKDPVGHLRQWFVDENQLDLAYLLAVKPEDVQESYETMEPYKYQGGELQWHNVNHSQSRPNQPHYQQGQYQRNKPIIAYIGNQGATDPQTIGTTENQVLNQTHRGYPLETGTREIASEVLTQLPANTGNILFNVQHVYHYSKDMEEKDVATSFHKHIPPSVKKRLNETLSQYDVWNQVKKMYGISEETPCPYDVLSSLLSQVEDSIASFIIVLLRLKEGHAEGVQVSENLIDEVKKGLMSEMEYNKLREKVAVFAEELSFFIERILDFLYQFSVIPDEETTKLKNDAKRNPRDACRNLFKVLLATSPKKEPIKHLKAAFRDSGLWYLADELEVSYQDVEDELQRHGLGGSGSRLSSLSEVVYSAPLTSTSGQKLGRQQKSMVTSGKKQKYEHILFKNFFVLHDIYSYSRKVKAKIRKNEYICTLSE